MRASSHVSVLWVSLIVIPGLPDKKGEQENLHKPDSERQTDSVLQIIELQMLLFSVCDVKMWSSASFNSFIFTGYGVLSLARE